MKKYWFYLEPYSLLFVNDDKALIYNSLSFEFKTFNFTSKLKEITLQLLDLNNMYCIELTDSDLSDPELKSFVYYARKSFSGDLLDKTIFKNKPVVLVPTLNLQKDVEKLREVKGRSIGENIKTYLNEVSFYLGGKKTESSLSTIPVFKQFDFCHTENNTQLTLPLIKSFLLQLTGCSLSNINIIGSDIFHSHEFKLVIKEFDKISVNKTFFIHYNDLPDNIYKFKLFKQEQYKLKILLDFPIQSGKFEKVIYNLNSETINTDWLFAITSEEEFNKTESLIKKYHLTNTEVKPVFNNNNLDFFEKNIYINEDDFTNCKLTRREIFINKVLNCSDFGKLTIMPNGNVYSNVNLPPLGTIEDSILEMLYKEMDKGTSWRRIKNQEPCNNCIYQWLCPSPSNYEFVIGKSNLCTVKV